MLHVIIVSCIVFCIIFTILVFATTGKMLPFRCRIIRSRYRENILKHTKEWPTEPLSGRVILLKCIGILVFAAILIGLALLAGADTFLDGFTFAFGLMVVVGAYDTFFLDWVLFANMKQFSG